MELNEAILKRRSVRKFTDHYVEDSEIMELLEAARWAPSWMNTQTWEFIIIRDKNVIEDIVSTYAETNPSIKCSKTASVLIAACAKKGVSGAYNEKDVTKFSTWYMFDIALACQNLCLKAHEIGLGTVVVSLLDHNKLHKVLELPNDYEVLAIMPIGEPLVKDKKPTPRKEIGEFTHLDKFGKSFLEK